MTKQEFIAYWSENSELPPAAITEDGVDFAVVGDGNRWVALPCACGEGNCQGWAMVPEDTVEHHMRFYAPREGTIDLSD
jgi:hypothetical protein